jgi:hypothetical protein
MFAWCPRKTKTGGLPNISFIMRKPEPLGKVCPVNKPKQEAYLIFLLL